MLSNFPSGHHFYRQNKRPRIESETRGNEDNCGPVYMSDLWCQMLYKLLHVLWFLANAATISPGPLTSFLSSLKWPINDGQENAGKKKKITRGVSSHYFQFDHLKQIPFPFNWFYITQRNSLNFYRIPQSNQVSKKVPITLQVLAVTFRDPQVEARTFLSWVFYGQVECKLSSFSPISDENKPKNGLSFNQGWLN